MSNQRHGVTSITNLRPTAKAESAKLEADGARNGEKSTRPPLAGTFRKVWPTERAKFRDHLLRLDKDSRRLRFAHSVTDAFIIDYADRMVDMGGVIHGYFEDGELHAVAELRKLGLGWGAEAEAAFSVEADYQNLGIGSELMGRVIRSARNRGIAHLYMSCLAENSRMQRIAKKHKATLNIEYGDVVGDILPQAPDYFSIISEAMEDRVGYMLAVLNIGQRRLENTLARPKDKN